MPVIVMPSVIFKELRMRTEERGLSQRDVEDFIREIDKLVRAVKDALGRFQ